MAVSGDVDAGAEPAADVTPPVAAAVPDTNNSPAALDARAAAAEPVVEAAPAAAPATNNEPPAWAKERIDTLTRRAKTAEEEAAAARAVLARLRDSGVDVNGTGAQPAAGAGAAPQLNANDIDRLARERAQQLRFKDRCDDVYAKGVSQYKDYDEVMANYKSLGGIPQSAVEAALETGAPEKVLYDLAKDLNEASRIFNLPPMAQAVALAKRVGSVAAPAKAVTQAPAPVVSRVNGTGTGGAAQYDETMSMEDYAAMRRKQGEARRASRR